MDRSNFIFSGDEGAAHTLVLAHGAGAPMDSPFMNSIAQGVAGLGIRVVRFEFPYMQVRRRDGGHRPPNPPRVLQETWLAVLETLGGGPGLFLGGKSMGGRIASLIADQVEARGLICLGYPFHPPGKPERLRVSHLRDLRTSTLIVQGSRDSLGNREDVAAYALSPRIRIHWLEDGDHSFKPRVKSGRTLDEHLEEAVAVTAAFIKGRDIRPPGSSPAQE